MSEVRTPTPYKICNVPTNWIKFTRMTFVNFMMITSVKTYVNLFVFLFLFSREDKMLKNNKMRSKIGRNDVTLK